MADINQTAAWVTARLTELGNATNEGLNTLVTDANIGNYSAGNVSGIVSVANGGTGANNAVDGLENLGGIAASDVSTVGKTGDYDDLLNKPTIPVIDQTYNGSTANGMSGAAMAPFVNELTDVRTGYTGTTYASAGDAVRAQASNLNDAIAKAFSTDQTAATAITSDSDLDDYKTPGNYKITTLAIANTIANIPAKISGRLFVFKTSDATKYWQIYCANYSSRTRVFLRNNIGGTWVDWYEITLPITTEPTEGSGGLITSGAVYTAITALSAHIDEVEAELEETINKSFPTNSASGDVITIQDGADGIPIKDMTVNITAVQSGTGDPSPINVRAISGWAAANIRRTGKNLIQLMKLQELKETATAGVWNGNVYTVSGITFTILTDNDGNILEVDASGARTSTSAVSLPVGTINMKNGENYLVNGVNTTNTSVRLNIAGVGNITSSGDKELTGDGASHEVRVQVSTTSQFTDAKFSPMIRLATDADPTFEPYTGNTYTIALGQTVYGGTLNPLTGHGWITHAIATLDGSQTYGVTVTANYTQASWAGYMSIGKANEMFVCDKFKSVAYAEAGLGNVWNTPTQPRAFFGLPTTVTTNAEAKQWFADNPTQLVYALANPIEIQLSPTQITTLLGQNNIWADCGDVSVTYRADPTLYVDGQIAPIKAMVASEETGTTASQAYSAGQYFILDGQFCKALTNIASGATFTLDTNYSVTTIAAELFSALNS